MKTLAKEHQFGVFQKVSGGGPNDWELGLSPGWRQPIALAGFFVSSTYFDLAGLTLQEKTLFFQGATATTMFDPLATSTAPGDSMQVIDLITSTPLDDTQLGQFFLGGNFSGPANATPGITYDQTIYALCQEYATIVDTATWGKMKLESVNQIGSMEPTASDRVYSYKLVSIKSGTAASGIQTYPTRHLLAATVKEEPEFQYLMRLKRSYELQQEPDVD